MFSFLLIFCLNNLFFVFGFFFGFSSFGLRKFNYFFLRFFIICISGIFFFFMIIIALFFCSYFWFFFLLCVCVWLLINYLISLWIFFFVFNENLKLRWFMAFSLIKFLHQNTSFNYFVYILNRHPIIQDLDRFLTLGFS